MVRYFVTDRLPYEEKETVLGTLKVLKTFSVQKDNHVIGGRVETGRIALNSSVKIIRRGVELGRGTHCRTPVAEDKD
jgi:translation initiation factor IF-2